MKEHNGVFSIEYKRIENYTMKCRLYPNKEQALKIDAILHGLRVAHNVTMYEMKHHNPAITNSKEGVYWPDFKKMSKAKWLNWLRDNYPAVNAVPAAALSTNNGLFNKDCKRAWEKIGKLPVDKWDVQYYSMKKPRKSFLIQKTANSFKMEDNPYVMKLSLPNIGTVKIRGWNNKL
jgi:transposase